MTDRELLELAAKAAGIEHGAERTDCGISITLSDGRHGYLPQWNPLTDDGDALRLAVKLRMGIHYETQFIDGKDVEIVEVYHSHDDDSHSCNVVAETIGDKAEAATRCAIVRAAAEIGKTLGE